MTSDIGPRIREIRLAKGATQNALARELGISKGFLCLLEQGKRSFKAGLVRDVAEALEVSAGALYGEWDWREEVPQDGQQVRRITKKDLRSRIRPVLGSKANGAVDLLAVWLKGSDGVEAGKRGGGKRRAA